MTRHLRTLIIGAALIVTGNAVALIGVVYNRSGEPDAVMDLSERELVLPYNYLSSTENSGLALHLIWRADDTAQNSFAGFMNWGGSTPWLTKAKLAELGFDVSADPRNDVDTQRYEKTLPRPAWVVLEFDGPAYQAALQQRRTERDEALALQANNPGKGEFRERAETAEKALHAEQESSSRLFAIDAGPDHDALRRQYPDRAGYLILSGEVRITVNNQTLGGVTSGLNATTVNVPLDYRNAIRSDPGQDPDHYTVRLAFGKRGEPWVLDARVEQ